MTTWLYQLLPLLIRHVSMTLKWIIMEREWPRVLPIAQCAFTMFKGIPIDWFKFSLGLWRVDVYWFTCQCVNINRHEGPVWQVAWSHPKFFSLLATSSYDGKVLIWKEENGTWTRVYEHAHHTASGTPSMWLYHSTLVNSIAWSPHELGLNLACGSSDGKISILTYQGFSLFFFPLIIEGNLSRQHW